jgi:hypothetical protein
MRVKRLAGACFSHCEKGGVAAVAERQRGGDAHFAAAGLTTTRFSGYQAHEWEFT